MYPVKTAANLMRNREQCKLPPKFPYVFHHREGTDTVSIPYSVNLSQSVSATPPNFSGGRLPNQKTWESYSKICFTNCRNVLWTTRFREITVVSSIVSFLLLSSICPISATHGKTEVPSAPLTEGTGRNLLQNLQFSGFLLSMYQDCGDSPIQHVWRHRHFPQYIPVYSTCLQAVTGIVPGGASGIFCPDYSHPGCLLRNSSLVQHSPLR